MGEDILVNFCNGFALHNSDKELFLSHALLSLLLGAIAQADVYTHIGWGKV